MKPQESVEAFLIISELTCEEGDSVTIHNPNGEFNETDDHDYCVSVVQAFNESEYFYGASVLAALKNAYRYCVGSEWNEGSV